MKPWGPRHFDDQRALCADRRTLSLQTFFRARAMRELLRVPLFLLGVVLHERLKNHRRPRPHLDELRARRRHEIEIAFVLAAPRSAGRRCAHVTRACAGIKRCRNLCDRLRRVVGRRAVRAQRVCQDISPAFSSIITETAVFSGSTMTWPAALMLLGSPRIGMMVLPRRAVGRQHFHAARLRAGVCQQSTRSRARAVETEIRRILVPRGESRDPRSLTKKVAQKTRVGT